MSDPERARHTAHEMARFLEIHMALHNARRLSKDPFTDLPVIWDALRTAYATHVRNLLEFFHEGTPRGGGRKDDITYGELLASNRYRKDWPAVHISLWDQATQLGAHISGKRPDHGDLPKWEDRGCNAVLLPMIEDAVGRIPDLLRHEGADVPALLDTFVAWQPTIASVAPRR